MKQNLKNLKSFFFLEQHVDNFYDKICWQLKLLHVLYLKFPVGQWEGKLLDHSISVAQSIMVFTFNITWARVNQN